MRHHVLANTTRAKNVVRASLPASFGGKMPPLLSIFRRGWLEARPPFILKMSVAG